MPDSNETVWILKNPLLKHTFDKGVQDGSVDPEDWREYLVAEPVKVRKTIFRPFRKRRQVGRIRLLGRGRRSESQVEPACLGESKSGCGVTQRGFGFDLRFSHAERNQTQVIDSTSFAVFDQSAIDSDSAKDVRKGQGFR